MNMQLANKTEQIVLNWLARHKITDFEFQSSQMGGHYELGGSVVDFLSTARGLAWRVQGTYWHSGVEKTGTDVVQRELLESQGWTVVDLWEQDLENPMKVDMVLQKALQGEEAL